MKEMAINSVHRNILESDMTLDQVFDQFVYDWGVTFSTAGLMKVWHAALDSLPELN